MMNFDFATISIDHGMLMGRICKNHKGRKFYSFQGIPYAKPPLGKFRFKAPEPPEPWEEDILDCTTERAYCYQRNIIDFDRVDGEEDCLYLNVYTPKISVAYRLLPVMVWIHGGAFVAGSGDMELCGPDYFMTKDIILITFNYRVGLLGKLGRFASFETEFIKVPGNAGLKDQVMVLKWIEKNIIKFRGDKDNVTLFGQSSGAACAHLHMLSPMSKGLFHRVILQSGCALNPWVNGVFGSGNLLAKELNIESDDDEFILRKLKPIPVEEIFEAQENITNSNDVDIRWLCSPVVEKQRNTAKFLPDEPINIIRSGNFSKVPMIIGYTSREGIYWDIYNRNITGKSEIITNFVKVIPNNLFATKGNLISDTIANRIENFYYGPRVFSTRMGRHPRLRMMDPLYQLLTDVFFLRGIHSTVKNHHQVAPATPIYYYKFTYETSLNLFKNMLPPVHQRKYPGVVHGDDLAYFFSTKYSPEIYFGSIEDAVIKRVIRMWTKFAATGNPNSRSQDAEDTWNPIFKNGFQYLTIGRRSKMDYRPDIDRMRFWDIIYENDLRTKTL